MKSEKEKSREGKQVDQGHYGQSLTLGAEIKCLGEEREKKKKKKKKINWAWAQLIFTPKPNGPIVMYTHQGPKFKPNPNWALD